MATSVKELLAAANTAVPRIDPAAAQRLLAEREALLVDVRDGAEVASTGKLRGAVHVSRGLLEFKADAGAPTHNGAFRTDRPVIVYCASGGRAALAGKTLKDLGYVEVHNLGGFKDGVAGGMPVEPV